MVDQVIFENANTKMRFTMNYQYSNGAISYNTQWTRVKLTYLLVSELFQSYISTYGGNFLWAGSVTYTVTNSGPYGVFGNNSIFANAPSSIVTGATCGYLNLMTNTTGNKFQTTCPAGDKIKPHYYIMGFMFAPGANTLAAMAQISDYTNAAGGGSGQNYLISGSGGAQGYGPVVLVDQFGGSLYKIKIGIVLTTLQGVTTAYPNNIQSFSYSGIYMPVTLKNQNIPVVQNSPTGYNIERYNIPNLSYGIYGLASFQIAPSSSCVAIDVDVTVIDLYTLIVNTDNTNQLTNVFVAADFYTKNTFSLCSGAGTPSRQLTDILSLQYNTNPNLIPADQNINQILDSTLPAHFAWGTKGLPDVNSSNTIIYTINATLATFVPGNAYQFTPTLTNPSAPRTWSQVLSGIAAPYIRFTIQLNGVTVRDVTFSNSSVAGAPQLVDYTGSANAFGLVVLTANPSITITIQTPRPVLPSGGAIADYTLSMKTTLQIDEFTTVYDPSTDCCASQCPSGSGLNLGSSPPTCIVCKGDPNLSYNSQTGVCTCQVGFYNALASVISSTQVNLKCFPCLAQLCATCTTVPTNCSTCVVGASFAANNISCVCNPGYYQSNGTCQVCSSSCTSCQVNGVCSQCSDPNNRILNQNCACAPGFYDSGAALCQACNPMCQTCNSSTICTTCFTNQNRTLVGGQCVCASGFYQFVFPNNSLTCLPCSP
jgi:hypothetical protein